MQTEASADREMGRRKSQGDADRQVAIAKARRLGQSGYLSLRMNDHRSAVMPPSVTRSTRSLRRTLSLTPTRKVIPSTPAFWAAFGAPASHGQRGHSGGIGRAVTTLPARRRPLG